MGPYVESRHNVSCCHARGATSYRIARSESLRRQELYDDHLVINRSELALATGFSTDEGSSFRTLDEDGITARRRECKVELGVLPTLDRDGLQLRKKPFRAEWKGFHHVGVPWGLFIDLKTICDYSLL